jgi:hypothetical protein
MILILLTDPSLFFFSSFFFHIHKSRGDERKNGNLMRLYIHKHIVTHNIELFMVNRRRKKENVRTIFRLKIHRIQFIFSSVTLCKLIAK